MCISLTNSVLSVVFYVWTVVVAVGTVKAVTVVGLGSHAACILTANCKSIQTYYEQPYTTAHVHNFYTCGHKGRGLDFHMYMQRLKQLFNFRYSSENTNNCSCSAVLLPGAKQLLRYAL